MGQAYELYEDDQEVDRFEVRDLRVKTRFAIDNAFYDEFTPIFGPSLSMAYLALVRHANKEQKTWPSQQRIADHLDLSREWVGVLLMILEIFNIIRKIRVGKGCTNRYYLIDEKQWRRDFNDLLQELVKAKNEYAHKGPKKGEKVMLTEFSSPMLRTGISNRAICGSYDMLLKFTSNSKDKQRRINKKDRQKVTIKKTTKSTLPKTPEHISIGEGSKSRTVFSLEHKSLVTYYYD